MQPDGPPLMSFLEPGLQGQQLGLVLRGWGSRGSEGAGKGEEGLRGLGALWHTCSSLICSHETGMSADQLALQGDVYTFANF